MTEALMRHGLDLLAAWGLEVSLDDRLYNRSGYLAGSDVDRAAALNDALADDGVDAVIFSRGGYGSMRILDAIDWSMLAAKPRFLVGFSDITALHLAAWRHAEVATIHGPVVKSFATQPASTEALRELLFETRSSRTVAVEPVRSGRAQGPLLGGNLSLVAAMLASRHMPNLDGAILALEDVTEEDYRLDRLFTALRLAGALDQLAGIVLGEFVECAGAYVSDAGIDGHVRALAAEIGDALGIPVVAGFPFGHGERNLPFWHGGDVQLDAEEGTLTLEW